MSNCRYSVSPVNYPDPDQSVRPLGQGCTSTVKENGGQTRYRFCDFQMLGTGACCVVIGATDHRMDFCLMHNIAK